MKESICKRDNWYVYAYYDPKDNEPFYIGKGTDLRAFSHNKGYGSKETSRKINIIRKKGQEPLIKIIARNLPEDVAYSVEMALIEFIGIEKLTNKQRGRGYRNHGLIPAESMSAYICGESLNVDDFKDSPVIMFRLNRLFRKDMTPVELYDITRHRWRIDLSNAEKCKYAMAVYEGRILEIYEIESWFDAGRTFILREESLMDTTRKEFVGRICKDKKVRKKFLGKSISCLPGYTSRKEFLYFGLPKKGNENESC